MNLRLTPIFALSLLWLGGCATPAAWERNEQRPLSERAEDVQPLAPGQHAAPATLRTPEGEAFDLAAAYRQRPTALVFYRGGWCPYCTTHLAALAEVEQRLTDMGYQVLAVSPDRPEKLRESLLEHDFAYRLLSDSDMTLARRFGVAFIVDEATRRQYEEFGIDLVEAAGEAHYMLPVPAVFLIDREGIIRFAYWDSDYRERLDGDELLAAAERALDAAEAARREDGVEARIRTIDRSNRRHRLPGRHW